MKNILKRILTDGKNVVIPYYINNLISYIIPKSFFKCRINRIICNIDKRDDYQYIINRVNYYNKLTAKRSLSSSKVKLDDFKFKDKKKKINSRYFFDTYEYVKYFDKELYFECLFGDITYVPKTPTIIKSRPIGDSNENSVLMNLDKLRHFVFISDTIPFRKKEDRAIFLSYITNKPHRIDFVEKFYDSSICICGDVQTGSNFQQWHHEKISLWAHLKYKFILTIEGNDVATNLKWVMSSNSVAVMPKPKYETWFMEGTLIADYHYIEIKDDYSDFEMKINYYIEHPEEAEQIIQNANKYIEQFKDKKREQIISYMVLDKYFSKVD